MAENAISCTTNFFPFANPTACSFSHLSLLPVPRGDRPILCSALPTVGLNETEHQYRLSSFETVLCCALLRFAQSQPAALFCAYTELLLCSPLQSQGEPPSPCLLPLQAFSPSNGAANTNQRTIYASIVKRLFTTWQEEGGSLSSHKSSLCNAIVRGKGKIAAPAFSCRRLSCQF